VNFNMKVQDLAKELQQSPKAFLHFLSDVGIKAKSYTTRLDKETVAQIRSLFDEKEMSIPSSKKEEAVSKLTKIVLPIQNYTIQNLAHSCGLRVSEIMRGVLNMGLLLSLNSEVDPQTASKILKELGLEIEFESEERPKPKIKQEIQKIQKEEQEKQFAHLMEKPPVITIMGHVDHGKTLLLDTIRKSNIIATESGGITQHIGAYQISVNNKKLTFLDTPGHAAFTALRARGAQLTDIVILVVAADEGVLPQTEEAIHHAKAANVPIIVAINKMDKPEANIDRCKQQLAEYELVAEEWGGKTIMVPISAKTGNGIDELLEMIILVSDMMELKASQQGLAKGIVIESRLSRKKGPVATVLIQSGILEVGSFFVIGSSIGKVRALLNDLGEKVTSAGPGVPVEILGIEEVPRPGDVLKKFKTEKEAKRYLETLEEDKAQNELLPSKLSLESLSKQVEKGELKTLNVIIKADVNGSLEAIASLLGQIESSQVTINAIRYATGRVTENDVMLAMASTAVILAFRVEIDGEAQKLADSNNIEIKPYAIIYEIVEDIQKTISGLFKPVMEEQELGRSEVRQLYHFSKIGTIAGCHVISGQMKRNATARAFREKTEIFSGKINSLKRFKEDVKEVSEGFECGIVLEGAKDLQEADVIVCYCLQEKKSK